MSRGRRHAWWVEPASAAAAALVWTLGRTWRLDVSGMAEYDRHLAAGGRCIFALWHSRLFPTLYSHRGRGVAALVSRSQDGEIIARVIERLGFVTARGSTTRGGEAGVLELMHWAEQGRSLTVTPDGPRGPAEHVKPGLVFLASHTGLPVLPVASAAAHEWVMQSWDRFRIPRPWSRVLVDYGPALAVPRDLDAAAAESWRQRIEQSLIALTAEVTQRAARQA